jgi:hypothetical protein
MKHEAHDLRHWLGSRDSGHADDTDPKSSLDNATRPLDAPVSLESSDEHTKSLSPEEQDVSTGADAVGQAEVYIRLPGFSDIFKVVGSVIVHTNSTLKISREES